MLEIADFFALSAPPPVMVALVFIAAYLLVGIPLHFVRGPVARDIQGSLAGIFAGLMYLTFIFGIYPDLHDTTATNHVGTHTEVNK